MFDLVQLTPGRIAAAALVLAGLLAGTAPARAAPVAYGFSTTISSGPLTGQTLSGTFAYDSSSITPGLTAAPGLLIDLAFTFNGIDYDESTANTGTLVFAADGSLTLALFGNDCAAGICTTTFGTNKWLISGNVFQYTVAGVSGPASFGVGQATVSLVRDVPEPAGPGLVAAGLAALLVQRRRAAAKAVA